MWVSAFLVGCVLWLYDMLDKAAIPTGSDKAGEPPQAPVDGSGPKASGHCGADDVVDDAEGGKQRRKLDEPREGCDALDRELDKDLEAGGDGKGKGAFASMCLGGRGASKLAYSGTGRVP